MRKSKLFGTYTCRLLLAVGCMTLLDQSVMARLPFDTVCQVFAAPAEAEISPNQTSIVMAQEQSYDNVAISQVNDYVNVRQEANTQSGIVGKIYNDCAATILATVDGEGGQWYQIQSGTVQGYIKAQYFITGEEAAKIAREVGTSYATIVNATTLRLHESPSLDSKTLTLLAQGARYQVIEESDGFTKLQIDTDLEGYVSSEYIEITVEFNQAVSLEEEAAKTAEEAKLKQEAEQAIQNLEEAKRQAEAAKGDGSGSSSGSSSSGSGSSSSGSSSDSSSQETSSSNVIEGNPGGNSDVDSAAPPIDQEPADVQSGTSSSGSSSSGSSSGSSSSSSGSGSSSSGSNSSAAGSSGTGSGSGTSEVGPGGSSDTSGSGSSTAGVYVPDGVTTATRSAIVAYAKQYLGNPYVYGGTSLTNGADCSGFVMSIFSHFGISTGRSSRDQAAKGKEIPVYSVQPGDLLFYSSGDYINHVGIYIGGGQIIHSSTPKTGITITKSNYRTPCKAVTFLN